MLINNPLFWFFIVTCGLIIADMIYGSVKTKAIRYDINNSMFIKMVAGALIEGRLRKLEQTVAKLLEPKLDKKILKCAHFKRSKRKKVKNAINSIAKILKKSVDKRYK